MHTQHFDPLLERRARRLERHGQYRVLRAVPPHYSFMPDNGAPPDGRCLALVDLETSGLNPEEDAIIELALMMVWINEQGKVVGHFGPLSWLEDPGVPLSPEITMVTGLASQHLTGKKIPDGTVMGLLSRADILVSHNASFEISWLERRYPELGGAPWGCTMKDIDWLKAGCEGRAQQHLLAQHGWFSEAHRAGPDVWSLYWLLRQERAGWERTTRSHLQRLIEGCDRTTTLVEARGAPIGKKDLLKGRGYRWNPKARVWAKEIDPMLVAHEQAWFFKSGLPAPTPTAMTACERHR